MMGRPNRNFFPTLFRWLLFGTLVSCGCQPEADVPEDSSPTEANIPRESAPMRSTADRMATRFTQLPEDVYQVPKIVEIPLPDFPGTDAIWGATGRDDRGHIWLGVAAGGVSQPSAHLLEYLPDLNQVYDRGNVVEALRKVRDLKPDESQMKIHSKIYPADDGYLYFASMDESGENSNGSAYPHWGGHLWRMKPFGSQWEHLFPTKEALIAVGGSGRWVYALGYFQHVLYQFDTQTQKTRKVQVGSVGGHISRNFLVDLNGHAYVPRVRREEGADTNSRLVAELVEWDENLNEIQAVPLPDYEATPDFDSHGIVGWTFLAGGDLLFSTSTGGLWRIHPEQAKATITRLGAFHPEGKSYPSVLFTMNGKRYACGIAQRPNGNYQWVVYDLETNASRAFDLNQEPFASHRDLLLYGSNTRDREGNAYVAGKRNYDPILLKVAIPKAN